MGLLETGGDNCEEQSENSKNESKTVNSENLSKIEKEASYTSAILCSKQNYLLSTSTVERSSYRKMADDNSKEIKAVLKSEPKTEKSDEVELLKTMEKLSVKEANMNELDEPSKLVLNNTKMEPNEPSDESNQNKETELPALKVEVSTELKTDGTMKENLDIELSALSLTDFYENQQTTSRRLPSVFDMPKKTATVEASACDDSDEEKESIPERGKHKSSLTDGRSTPYDCSRSSTPMSTLSGSSSSSQSTEFSPARYRSRMSGGTCTVVQNVQQAVSQPDLQSRLQLSNFHHLAVGVVQQNDAQQQHRQISQLPVPFPPAILNNANMPMAPMATQYSGVSPMYQTVSFIPPPSPAFSEEARMAPGILNPAPSINDLSASETAVYVGNWINNNSVVTPRSFTELRPDDESRLTPSFLSSSPSSSIPLSPQSPSQRIDSPTSNDMVMSILNIRDRADSGASEEVSSSSSDDEFGNVNVKDMEEIVKDWAYDLDNLPLEILNDIDDDINLDSNGNEHRNDNETASTSPPAVVQYILVLPNANDNLVLQQRRNSGNRFRRIIPRPNTNSISSTNTVPIIQNNVITSAAPVQSYSERLRALMKKDILNKACVFVDSQPDSYFLNQDDGDTLRDTPIHIVMNNSIEFIYAVVTRCKARNIPLDTRNAVAQTPLFCAVGKTNPDPLVVGFLIELGADPAHMCIDGTTPLHIVAKRGDSHAEIARILCKACRPIDLDKRRDGCTPLVYALKFCETTCIKIVEILLSHGAQINSETVDGRDGRSALHLAVDKGNLELVRVICKTYPRINDVINSRSNTGETPLHVAAKLNSRCSEEQQIAIIKLLFEYGAENKQDNYRNNPRNVVSPSRPTVAQLLRSRR